MPTVNFESAPQASSLHILEHKRPYIGVSGVISPEMQSTITGMGEALDLSTLNRTLLLGVKAVHKTQYLDIENKYGPEWYPVGKEAFADALIPPAENANTLAVAQVYLDINHVAGEAYRNSFVQQIAERGKPWIKGIQFDMLPWHNSDDMLHFLDYVKDLTGLELFVQAHGIAMSELTPKELIARIATSDVVDYLLFDASHGTGKRLDTDALHPYVEAAYAGLDTQKTGIAIAGGLNAEIVSEELPVLLADFPNLSWDAEKQLHPFDEAGKRPLDMGVVQGYLAASANVLKSSASSK